ncbi:MAG TPA: hypothetical protein VJL78_04410 [Candidatus Nitrosocosmicus sp.]|jgi:hypothetical protein|nr:hypothetical protein [Candidatus Nitrosocosmicus sp.]
MSVRQDSNIILQRDSRIKFIGILKNGNQDISFSQDNKIDENDVKLSMIQTPHILEAGKRFTDLGNLESVIFEYDKMKLYNLPLGEETVIFGTNNEIKNEEIMKLVSNNATDFQNESGSQHLGEKTRDYDKASKIDSDSIQAQTDPTQFENPWQNYISNLIEFWKEFAITYIRMNEKMVTEFWKSFSNK